MQKAAAKVYLAVIIILILLAVTGREGRFLGFSFKQETAAEKPLALEDARRFFPEAAKIVVLAADEAEVYDGNGGKIGTLVNTMPMTKHIIGYGSYLPILIGLDLDQRVAGIFLQENGETPGFIKRLEKQQFFNTWDKLPATEVVGREFDAVSRATLTTRAVIDSLKLRLSRHIAIEQERQKIDYRLILLEVLAWFFLALSLSGCVFPARIARFRTAILVMAVAIPGFMLGRFISLELIRSWAINGIPFAAQPFLALVLMLTFAIPVFTGKAYYCTWFCPYGAAQELAGKLIKYKINLGGAALGFCRWFRPAFFMGTVFLLLIGVNIDVSKLEPFSAFMFRSAADLTIVLALVFLGLSLFVRKPWCNYVCPSGQLVEIVRTWPQQTLTAKKEGEGEKMKVQEVISLLLAIAVVILVMSPGRIADNGQHQVMQKGMEQKKSTATNASASSQLNSPKDAGVEKSKIVLENIYARKSVRDFTGQLVSKENLTELVKAGMAAPTARNRQPWQFVVINEKDALQRLSEQLPYAKMLASAGAAIVVCGDLDIAKAGETEKLWTQDCSAATQNILLAAESMGLGAVWTAAYPYDDRMSAVVSALSLPEQIVPLNVIPIGYPTGVDKPKDKWKPERLHWNKFIAQEPGK